MWLVPRGGNGICLLPCHAPIEGNLKLLTDACTSTNTKLWSLLMTSLRPKSETDWYGRSLCGVVSKIENRRPSTVLYVVTKFQELSELTGTSVIEPKYSFSELVTKNITNLSKGWLITTVKWRSSLTIHGGKMPIQTKGSVFNHTDTLYAIMTFQKSNLIATACSIHKNVLLVILKHSLSISVDIAKK